ncbi:mitochondrial 54S ribosomal protein YmL22 [Saccharomycopsis crataegensis]|uniref:Mitochondrial 54S ribosomal protein YmL22 n=1 Tax=Saccharomycopsis crataegensis TaxID=43959 RepID=A0AAV5QQ87_9ASCO|nr:mitochondrial 54S ribosomal protein YmL22 [Saccharomycopsis crataegensis]
MSYILSSSLSAMVLRQMPVARSMVMATRQSVGNFHTSHHGLNNKSSSSLFSDITEAKTTKLDAIAEQANKVTAATQNIDESADDGVVLTEEQRTQKRLEVLRKTLKPEDDTLLQNFYKEQYKPLVAVDSLLSPLKKQVYLANVAKFGFFMNGESVKLDDGKSYRLSLKPEEIEVLEPSIYLKSYRIKSSAKKATLVTRLLNGLSLKDAINQCHFSKKKIAKELGEVLETGITKAKEVELDANKLFVSRIWSGSDGRFLKRQEWKGRGRMGVITHRYIHVRMILRGEQTKLRLAHEKKMKAEKKKAWEQLPSEPIRGVIPGLYKW